MPNASAVYKAVLRDARARSHSLSRDAVRRIKDAFVQAIKELKQLETSDNPLTAARATALKDEVIAVLNELMKGSNAVVRDDVVLTINDIVKMHAEAVKKLVSPLISGERVAKIGASFTVLPIKVVAAFNSRRVGSAAFETLMRRNMLDAAPAIDRMISAALTDGKSASRLANDLAQLLSGNTTTVLRRGADVVDLTTYGVKASDVGGLSSLFYDARRIAVSEINNSYREANNLSLKQSPLVAAVQWTLSGNHPAEDDCDDLANADDFGFGPGFYPPGDDWPDAPHPWCGCYQGDIQFVNEVDW